MYLNSLCSEKMSKTAYRADRAEGLGGEVRPPPQFKSDHFTLNQPDDAHHITSMCPSSPLPLPDFLIFLRRGPQWAKMAEKLHKPPLGVNVIN